MYFERASCRECKAPFVALVKTFLSLTKHQMQLYFNVTEHCNSDCIFCAGGIPNLKNRVMLPPENILQIYSYYHLGTNDDVIINGGEPTLYPALAEIINEAASRGAKVTLFTNGRLLNNLNRARNWLGSGVYKVSIPLYGSNANTHDMLTRRMGSFDQTVKGIRNAFQLQAEIGFPEKIELKLLAVRGSLREWPAIIDFIAKEFGKPNILVMSGLNMWSTAVSLYKMVSPTIKQMQDFVNLALQYADAYRFPVSLWAIPLCILTHENRKKFLEPYSAPRESHPVRVLYFDPHYPNGVEYDTDEFLPREEVEPVCQECNLAQYCGPGRVFYQQLLSIST